jgi:hypothetical protein
MKQPRETGLFHFRSLLFVQGVSAPARLGDFFPPPLPFELHIAERPVSAV